MQEAGKVSAIFLLMLTPYLDPSPSRTVHRHLGFELTTLANAVQQLIEGVGAAPVTKGRHGASGMMTELQSGRSADA